MNILFLIIISVPIIYILNTRRRLDYLLVAVLSTFIYYFPALIGRLRVSSYSNETVPIHTSVYFSIIAYILVLTLFLIITDNYLIKIGNKIVFKKHPSEPLTLIQNMELNIGMMVVEILGIILLMYSLKVNSGFSVNFNKMTILAKGNRFTEYLKYIALFSFVYSFINTGKFIGLCRFFSAILIGYTFLIGHRSFIFLGIIGITVYYLRKVGYMRLITYIRKHLFAVCLVIVLGLFFLFIKGVFAALITGQMDIVMSRLTDPEYYVNTLLTSEANSITYNLQNVCETGMKYSLFQYITGLVLLIPVVGGKIGTAIGYTAFETELNLRFNDRLNEGIGLGSTFLGEAYSLGGTIAVVIISAILLWILVWLNRKYENSTNGLNLTFMSVVLPYLTFYVHRNSAIFLLVTVRAYLYIFVLVYLISEVVKICLHIKK